MESSVEPLTYLSRNGLRPSEPGMAKLENPHGSRN